MKLKKCSTAPVVKPSILDAIEKHYFNILIKSSICFFRHLNGKMIIVYGTSSSGKSSLCHEFSLQNPTWQHTGNDLIFEAHVRDIVRSIETMRTQFPAFYHQMARYIKDENIPDALLNKRYLWKTQISHQEQTSVKQQYNLATLYEHAFENRRLVKHTERLMFEHIINLVSEGNSVIVDTLDYKNFAEFLSINLFKADIRYVLTFCPMLKMSERITSRNNAAIAAHNFEDIRQGPIPFFQYPSFFKATNADNPNLLDRFTTKEMHHNITSFLKTQLPADIDFNFESEQIVKNILNRLGVLNQAGEISVCNREPVDLVLDTSQLNVTESIGRLNDKLGY